MAIWKCNRCEKEFYDGGEPPVCPACQARTGMLTALDGISAGQDAMSGNLQYIEQNILDYAREAVESSPYLNQTVQEIRRRGENEILRIGTEGGNRERGLFAADPRCEPPVFPC